MTPSGESDLPSWADSRVRLQAVAQLVDLRQEAIQSDLGGTEPGSVDEPAARLSA